MKMVYTHENSVLVHNAKNIIAVLEIPVFIKNEFSQGAAGELSTFDAWAELWIVNDEDYECAIDALKSLLVSSGEPVWVCKHCFEENDPSFDVCWQCQTNND